MYGNVLYRRILAVFIFLGAVYGNSEISKSKNSNGRQETSSAVYIDLQPRIKKPSRIVSVAGASGIGDEICFCLCDNPETFHLPQTAEETQAFIEDFKKEVKIKLLVNKKNLSSTVSRKGSIVDNRPSAAYVGSLGIIMLLVVFISLVLLDLPRGIAFYKALKYQQ